MKLNYIYIPATGEVINQNTSPLHGECEMSLEEYLHKKIKIPNKKDFYFEFLRDITYLEKQNRALHIHLPGKVPALLDRAIWEALPLFPKNHFCQPHESFIVNMHHIKKYKPGDPPHLEMNMNAIIPVTRGFKDQLVDSLNTFAIGFPPRNTK